MSALKILCVDDDLDVLKAIESVLLHKGFEVTAVASVPEALELVNRKTFDVLLTDLNVGQPGDGFTVVSAMRRVQPNVCTFILTGYPDIESAIRAIRSQVDDYFSKPLNIDDLIRAIDTVGQGRRPATHQKPLTHVSELVAKLKPVICERWLEEVVRDPELAAIPLSRVERMDHLPGLLDELVERMKQQNAQRGGMLGGTAVTAARAHGRMRYQQGYTIPQMLQETRILQTVLSDTIQKELLSLELSALIPEVFEIGQSLHAAMEVAIHAYQAQVPHSLQASLSTLYKSPHLGVAIADQNHIIDANDALLRMIGHSREQLIASEVDWMKMTPERFQQLDINALEQLREFGTCVPYEKEFLLPDGSSLPFLIGAVRLQLEPLQWCAYIADLRQQRKLQDAEQKEKDWGFRFGLINRLAHEINNPLAALMFTCYLMRTHEGMSEDARQLVAEATMMLVRINESVQKVLAESRME